MPTNTRSLLDVILGRNQSTPGNQLFFFNNRTKPGNGGITPENALDNPTVLSCVNLISQGIAQLDWGIHDRDDMPSPDHQLNVVLDKPNSFLSQYEFKVGLVQDLLLYGNSYTRVLRAANGRVINLIPMDPGKISVSANSFGIPVYDHSDIGIMQAPEVIHVRDVQGHDVIAKSRTIYAGTRIAALNAADALMNETFTNGVSVNYSVELDGSMDDTTRTNLYDQLKSAFGAGGSRRGGVAVIEGGRMTAMKGSTPADADLRALRATLINEIAAIYRVPASLVGGTGDEKFNNVTARLAAMYRDTFQPIITSIEQAFSNNLATNGNRVVFDVSTLVKGDLMSQVTIATTASGGAAFLTQNEAREFIGYQPLEDEEYDRLGPEQAPEQVESDDRRGESDTDEGNLGEPSEDADS